MNFGEVTVVVTVPLAFEVVFAVTNEQVQNSPSLSTPVVPVTPVVALVQLQLLVVTVVVVVFVPLTLVEFELIEILTELLLLLLLELALELLNWIDQQVPLVEQKS